MTRCEICHAALACQPPAPAGGTSAATTYMHLQQKGTVADVGGTMELDTTHAAPRVRKVGSGFRSGIAEICQGTGPEGLVHGSSLRRRALFPADVPQVST